MHYLLFGKKYNNYQHCYVMHTLMQSDYECLPNALNWVHAQTLFWEWF